jgi:hypothetical protein
MSLGLQEVSLPSPVIVALIVMRSHDHSGNYGAVEGQRGTAEINPARS